MTLKRHGNSGCNRETIGCWAFVWLLLKFYPSTGNSKDSDRYSEHVLSIPEIRQKFKLSLPSLCLVFLFICLDFLLLFQEQAKEPGINIFPLIGVPQNTELTTMKHMQRIWYKPCRLHTCCSGLCEPMWALLSWFSRLCSLGSSISDSCSLLSRSSARVPNFLGERSNGDFQFFSLYIMSDCGSLHPHPSGVGGSPREDDYTGHTKYLDHPISGSSHQAVYDMGSISWLLPKHKPLLGHSKGTRT